MVKSKQKNGALKVVSKKKMVFMVAGILALLIVALIAVRIYESNQTIQDQKSLLNKSLEATRSVYNQYASDVSNPKKSTLSPSNNCVKVGAKYSTDFNCGTSAILTVYELDEVQYITLNNRALEIYRSNEGFERVGVTQPKDNGLNSGLTGTASSRFRDSDLHCYYSSNYRPEKRAASFSWSCTLVSRTQLFPLQY